MFKNILFLIFFSLPIFAQTNAAVAFVTVAPSGACQTRTNLRLRVPNGTLFSCQNGTWGQISGSGGSGTVTSVIIAGTANQITPSGTCTITTSGTCTLSIPNVFTLPGTINKLTLTAPATGATFTLVDNKTFTVNNTITLAGTDAQTYTFPTASATIARTDSAQTFTGAQTFSTPIAAASIGVIATVVNSGTITIPSGNSIVVICTSTCSVPVPVPVLGYEICVKNIAGGTTVITMSALGSSAMYPKSDDSGYGTAGTGTMVSSSAAGNKICLIGKDSTHYELGAVNASANWTVN